MKLFKQKDAPVTSETTLAQVADKHLGTFVRLTNATNLMKAGLMAVAIIGMTSTWLFGDMNTTSAPEIATIEIKGHIAEGNETGNGAKIAKALKDAIKNENTKAILITANSGGGSPVQGEIINEAIKAIKANRVTDGKGENRDIPIIVSIEDMCASACLLAIINADAIYAHKNSLVGSIGVRIDGYAIDDALSKIGIERRVMTSGINKALLDPYANWTEEQESKVRVSLLEPLFEQFVTDVKEARGAKLDATNPDLFTGMVWTGNQGLTIGLVDDVKTIHEVKHELMSKYDAEKLKAYNKPGFSFSKILQSSFTDAISFALERQLRVEG